MFILIESFGLQNYGLERLLGAFLKLGLKGFNQQYLLQVQSTHRTFQPILEQIFDQRQRQTEHF
jgi:hypothetical protein